MASGFFKGTANSFQAKRRTVNARARGRRLRDEDPFHGTAIEAMSFVPSPGPYNVDLSLAVAESTYEPNRDESDGNTSP